MKRVPEWVKQIINSSDLKCINCDNSCGISDLSFMGVKNVREDEDKQCLCIGMICSKCKEMITFDVGDMSLVDFALEILENEAQMEEDKENKKNKNLPQNSKINPKKNDKKSKITVKDVKDAATLLSRIGTHEEFLMILGMTPEEIREYDYKPATNNKKKNTGETDDGKGK